MTIPTGESWFPIRSDMLEAALSAKLTSAERVILITMIRDANQNHPGWFKADVEYAIETHLSEDKIRRARRKFQKEGWVSVTPGFKSKGRAIATVYHGVNWATAPVRGKGVAFVPFVRYFWDVLLEHTRSGNFMHCDIPVMVALVYARGRLPRRAQGHEYVGIAKGDIRDLSGIANIRPCIDRLHDNFTFKKVFLK